MRITAPKVMVNVISAPDQALISEQRCWVGTRVTAKDAMEPAYVMLATEPEYARLVMSQAVNAVEAMFGVCTDAL